MRQEKIVFDRVILQDLSVMERISSPQCTRRITNDEFTIIPPPLKLIRQGS